MKIRVSEIFASMQGEGLYTGVPSLWIRFFGCNLQCNGFGQKDPSDPSTYILPYRTIDLTDIKKMEDLPVFPYGCDSGYSWSAKFKHLAEDLTEEDIFERLRALGKDRLGVDIVGKSHFDGPKGHYFKRGWAHELTGTPSQLCFTGGEPMLYQKQMNAIVECLEKHKALPRRITIETNATQEIKHLNIFSATNELHISCSPKLYYVSGEQCAFNKDAIEGYMCYADSGVLKFVHNGSEKAWDELEEITESLKDLMEEHEGKWHYFIMPVGATVEAQSSEHISSIASEALRRGFNVSARAHVQIFGNKIGT